MDFVAEFLGLIPSWKRRQLLVLDEVLQFVYGNNELWYDKVY